jgi:predicted dithiol-disulfide oxidoreductase (DUF899 family)
MSLSFPGESTEYRSARNELLRREIDLRREIESVAAARRALPAGGAVPENYVFEGVGVDGYASDIKLSELFAPGLDSLAIYSFMFGPDREAPCPSCTSLLDGLEGVAEHIGQRVNLAIVAKAPLSRLTAFAYQRGWRRLRMLSTTGNSYDHDYFGDTDGLPPETRTQLGLEAGWDQPMLNMFRRDGETIRHFWGSELLYEPPEPGQHMRHNDLLVPFWNLFDLTPDGRGDFNPERSYA